jgi:hypothetical protein
MAHRLLDPNSLFAQKTRLINDVNRDLEPGVFNTFVPNYKTLASIAQIFSDKISPKDLVLLEGEIIKKMTQKASTIELPTDIDNLVVSSFTNKFNNKYENELLAEQKELLTYYISSFADNALELKMFLNEEIARLKADLEKATLLTEIREDEQMLAKTEKIVARLEELRECTIDDEILLTVMKTQSLVKEIYSDGHHS